MSTKLSIIIPVYNTVSYLGRCITSLTSQIKNENCVELILVDDGSSDGSERLCDLFEKDYPYIKTIHKTNGGLASARNAGLDAASGEYVSFLDSDDWLDAGAVSEFLRIITEFSPAIIGFGCKRTTGEAVYQTICQAWPEGISENMRRIRADIINDSRLFRFGVIRSSCMHVFRKDIIDRYSIRFVSERLVLNEDYLFITEFIMHAESYYNIRKHFYNYYTREGSLTQKHLTNMYGRKKELLARYRKVLENFSDPLGEYAYRTSLFYLDSCYECLANECAVRKPDKKLIAKILSDIKESGSLKHVDRSAQSAKARVVMAVMGLNNASAYIAYYRMFSTLKNIRKRQTRRKGQN